MKTLVFPYAPGLLLQNTKVIKSHVPPVSFHLGPERAFLEEAHEIRFSLFPIKQILPKKTYIQKVLMVSNVMRLFFIQVSHSFFHILNRSLFFSIG